MINLTWKIKKKCKADYANVQFATSKDLRNASHALARSWAKIASYKNLVKCDVRRTRPRAITMTMKNPQHAV